MPSVEENLAVRDGTHDWPQAGEEWSERWGGSEMQWRGCLLPRLHSFVPCESILEIAPGFGRWTHFLKDLCAELTLARACCKSPFCSGARMPTSANCPKNPSDVRADVGIRAPILPLSQQPLASVASPLDVVHENGLLVL